MAFPKKMNDAEQKAAEAVRPLCGRFGLTLWDVVFVKEGAAWYLRVLIDKPGGVSIDDCAELHPLAESAVDKLDFADKIDYFEVGSAGLERLVRTAEQLEGSVGRRLRIRTFKQCEYLPCHDFKGILEKTDGEKIFCRTDFGHAQINFSDISAINYDDFDDFDADEEDGG